MLLERTPVPSPEKVNVNLTCRPKFFDPEKSGIVFFILCTAIVCACFFVFKDYLLMQKVYLFKDIGSDSVNIYFPWLVHLSDYMLENGYPAWTFSQGLGQNIFPFWLGDIFSVFLSLFISKPLLPFSLVWMEVLKILLCGIFFYGYLRELKLNGFAAGLCAFMYAFCGYIILGGCWTIFSIEALYAAMILYGVERWLNRGKWLWYVIALTFMSLLQPFFLFMYALFLAAYIPVRYADLHQVEWRKFTGFTLKTLGLSAVGVAVSAYQLLPDVLRYLESPRVGGEVGLGAGLRSKPVFALADELLRFSTVFRSFGSDILGSGSNFTGWSNYLESPLFYCGILCLVTFTQFLPSRDNVKQKLAYGVFTVFWFLPLFLPFLRYSFWAFSGDYFRTFSLLITIILLMYSARSIHYIVTAGKLNKTVLGATVGCLLFLLYTPSDKYSAGIDLHLRNGVSVLICTYALLLLALTASGRRKRIAQVFMLVVCFAELIFFSHVTVNNRVVVTAQELQEKTGYNDYTVEAVKYLKSIDKGFYRIEKDFRSGPAIHTSLNDAQVQGYFGTKSYASFNQINYIRFLSGLNVINGRDESDTRWAAGVGDRPLLFSLVSGKYWLSKKSVNYPPKDGFYDIATVGDVHIYRNIYALPLGFTYDHVMEEDSFKLLNPLQKDQFLLKGCVVASEEKQLLNFPRINPANIPWSQTPEQLNQAFAARFQESLVITKFTENNIYGEVSVPDSRILFLSIPFDGGWHAKVNGVDTTLYRVNLGFTGIVMPAGKNLVELHFTPRFMNIGAMISILAIVVIFTLLLATRLRKLKTAVPVAEFVR